MNDLEKAINRMHERLDSPTFRLAREIQDKMDALRPPVMREYLDSTQKLRELATSPAQRAITDIQNNLRLSINPRFEALLEENERIKDIVNPRALDKITRELTQVSKWKSSVDTPASVFKDVSNFSKKIEWVSGTDWEPFNYREFLDRISTYDPNQPFIEPKFNASLWNSFHYTLIDEEETEPETQIVLLDEGNRIKRLITEVYRNNQKLFTVDPRDFEEMIAELLRFQQFEVELTKRTKDGGVDIIAVKSAGEFPVRFMVECKRFAKNRKISVDIVRSFRDVVRTHGANMGIIVTSSYFSVDAKKDSKRFSPYLLDFKDHDDVIRWVNQYVN